jgi:hypothetical protein
MSRSWIVATLTVALLTLPLVARAHEGHMHKALGTIASVQAQRVEITTTDGKALTVVIDKKTTITRGKEKLDAAALIAGERVSVDYMEQNKTKTAHAIKLGTTPVTAKK